MQAGETGGPLVFRKLRCDGTDAAAREWRWLLRLPELGFAAPLPVCFARLGRSTAVVALATEGRPLAALLGEAESSRALEYARMVVAPLVSRLHAQGVVFRDLYWNHLFAPGLDARREPAFIDVERVLTPMWRWRRWVVKDLAGLVATWPRSDERQAFAVELTASYLAAAGHGAARLGGAAQLTDDVIAKAARIAGRRPRYGA